MQITPNGIEWMTWFLAFCNKSKYQPTFRIFHQLFTLVPFNIKPLYELCFKAAECGFGSIQAKPMIPQSLLKHWNGKMIMLKGLDRFYLPYISMDKVVTDFRLPVLEGEALQQILDFCNCLGSQITRDSFMDHRKLYRYRCM